MEVDLEKITGTDLANMLSVVKHRYEFQAISRSQAEKEAASIIAEMNRRGKVISKKYNRRFVPFTLSSHLPN